MYIGCVITYGVLLLVEAWMDLWKKEVPIWLFVVGLVPTVLICQRTPEVSVSLRLIGLGIGVALWLLGRIMKDAIGAADAVAVGQMGIAFGALCVVESLALSLGILMFVAILLYLLKKVGRKDTIPFLPFWFVGFIGTVGFGGIRG